MLRWLIGLLILANLIAFAMARGVFGPTPAAGSREPNHLERQIHPDWLTVRPLSASQAADQPVVGGPVPVAPVQQTTLTQ